MSRQFARMLVVLGWVVAFAAGGAVHAAPAPPTTPATLDSALARELAALEGTRIDLETAVELAAERSTEVLQAAEALHAAEATVKREKGVFDPELFATGQYVNTDAATASPFAGAPVLKTDGLNTNFGVGKEFTTGTRLTASMNTNRSTTNSSFASLTPQYNALGSVDVVQPLLKGFGISTSGELRAAEHELAAARSNYAGSLESVRSQVERTYWVLYAAERNSAVEKLVRDGAGALEESAKRRAAAGLVGPNQVANARVFLANEEIAVLDAGENLGAASDRLASIMGRRPDPGLERFRTTAEPPREFEHLAQDSVVALALEANHTLSVLASHIEAQRDREHAAGRDALPTLDLVGSLGANGLAGTGKPVYFGSDTLLTDVNTDWSDSWNQVFKGDFPTWSAGVLFRMPIGRREGTGEKERQEAERRFAEQEYVAARRSLEEVVRTQHRELENATARLQFAKQGVDAAFDQTRIGRLEFENGRTTAFELVRVAGDLAAAQLTYSRALVRAATAAATLRELTAGAYPKQTVGR